MPIHLAMEVSPILLQFVGSLVAIGLLAALTHWLKLGPTPKLVTEQDARNAADQVHDGFQAVEIGIDQAGKGALLRNAAGQVMLLRAHGSHFAGRILPSNARMELSQDGLIINSAEKRFGTTQLQLQQPEQWVNAWEENAKPAMGSANA